MTLTTVVDAIERELLLRKQNRKINMQQELLYKSEKKQRELFERDLVMKDEFITLIGSIKRNTFRQLRLVNNLLDITKLHSEQFKLNKSSIKCYKVYT